MSRPPLVALFFALASLVWLVLAIRIPEMRFVSGMLALANVALALTYLRRGRTGPR